MWKLWKQLVILRKHLVHPTPETIITQGKEGCSLAHLVNILASVQVGPSGPDLTHGGTSPTFRFQEKLDSSWKQAELPG